MKNTSIAKHWRLKQQRYRLMGRICPDCDMVTFPPREVCPHCAELDAQQAHPWEEETDLLILADPVI